MISKKAYVDFARMIRAQRQKVIHQTDSTQQPEISLMVRTIKQSLIDDMVNELCDLFERDNPQFKAHQFIAACEIDTESK